MFCKLFSINCCFWRWRKTTYPEHVGSDGEAVFPRLAACGDLLCLSLDSGKTQNYHISDIASDGQVHLCHILVADVIDV